MRSILFQAIAPSEAFDRRWLRFCKEALTRMPPGRDVAQLATGVWLVTVPDARMVVELLAGIALGEGIPFRLLHVQHEGEGSPEWQQGRSCAAGNTCAVSS